MAMLCFLLRPLTYTTHPYRWPTIGMDISHLENVELDHVNRFLFVTIIPLAMQF